MDILRIITNLFGLGGDYVGKAKKVAQAHGVSSATIDELTVAAKDILADGKITPAEVEGKLASIAREKGVPEAAINIITGILSKSK